MANIGSPSRQPIVDDKYPNSGWDLWFTQAWKILKGDFPFPLKSYTVATAPDAASYEGNIIYVSNEAGGKTVAFSDGTNWRRVQDRVIIS